MHRAAPPAPPPKVKYVHSGSNKAGTAAPPRAPTPSVDPYSGTKNDAGEPGAMAVETKATPASPPAAAALGSPVSGLRSLLVRGDAQQPMIDSIPEVASDDYSPDPLEERRERWGDAGSPASSFSRPRRDAATRPRRANQSNFGVDEMQRRLFELQRENKMLHERVAVFLRTSSPGELLGERSAAALESFPPSFLASRIRQLEAALVAECAARDRVELQLEAHRLVLERLTAVPSVPGEPVPRS